MWLSEKTAMAGKEAHKNASMGTVTIDGQTTGVLTDREDRKLAVVAPGGYVWRPSGGDNVLVITDEDGQRVITGGEQSGAPDGFACGEVYIMSKGGASIYIDNDGKITIRGDVTIHGNAAVSKNLTVYGAIITPNL